MSLPDPHYIAVNVDAGIIDNKPFFITLRLLLNSAGETDKENKDYKSFRNGVPMVTPFTAEEAEKISI